ncbi:hypothetical protein BXZ70DRAFT_442251 [Cristinia sonorae]|uniref:FAD-binding domain-containing protein n=1 Tax=Cristinia sonorae TaxID=1940300 RepID=A0A8K0XMG1_9AGAR|nr:hypothetical protein BXZ70DRAFT_442251 [Cristinia sonorae]
MLPESTQVLIVGAGPAGLSCAVSLVMNGCKPEDITVVDAQAAGLNLSRAIVIHAKTVEELDTIGVMEKITSRGLHANYMTVRAHGKRLVKANFASLNRKTRFPYALLISQAETEQILEERLKTLGVTVNRPYKVVDMKGSDDGVTVSFEGGEAVKARYVVGADGARSIIRKLAAIPFTDPDTNKDPFAEEPKPGESVKEENARLGRPLIIADVHLSGNIPSSISPNDLATFLGPLGFLLLVPLPASPDDPEGRTIYRMSCPAEPGVKEVSKERLQKVLAAALSLPKDKIPEVDTIIWSSRFRVRHAVADRFFQFLGGGAVALAGDAAHVHSPAGGQGMNLGVRDAISLGRILGDIVKNNELNTPTVSAKKAYAMQRLEEYSKTRREMALKVIKMTKVMTWATGLEKEYARATRNGVWWLMGRGSLVNNKLALRMSGLELST